MITLKSQNHTEICLIKQESLKCTNFSRIFPVLIKTMDLKFLTFNLSRFLYKDIHCLDMLKFWHI